MVGVGARYQADAGFWAVAGRLSFIFMVGVIVWASFLSFQPRWHGWYGLNPEHIAVSYCWALSTSAAFVRRNVLHLAIVSWSLALAIELLRALNPAERDLALVDWLADAAGIAAALGPIGIARFRDGFRPLA